MKKAVLGFIICLFIFSFFGSCKKSNKSNTVPNSFVWTFGGNTYTASLDSAYEQSIALAPYYIVAINGTNLNTFFTRKIGFSLTSFTPGNYSLGTGSNTFAYIDDLGFNHGGVSGTLNITTNSNNLLSGNFTGILAGPGGNSPVSGSFTNVTIRP